MSAPAIGKAYTAYIMAAELHIVTGKCVETGTTLTAIELFETDAESEPKRLTFPTAAAHLVEPEEVGPWRSVVLPSIEFLYLLNSPEFKLKPEPITGVLFKDCVDNGGIVGYLPVGPGQDTPLFCNLANVQVPTADTFWENFRVFGKDMGDLGESQILIAILGVCVVENGIAAIKKATEGKEFTHEAVLQACVFLFCEHRIMLTALALLKDESEEHKVQKAELFAMFAGMWLGVVASVKPPGRHKRNTQRRQKR